ncbi:MAG TPA: hypothetical protein VJA21_27975 [Verrucomicrobiae bacterium]
MSRLSTVLLIPLMLFVVYVLTYFVAVKPAALVAITAGQGPWSRMPEYRFGAWSEGVYEPILRLDRKLFPGRWQVTRAELEKNTRRRAAP